MQRLIVSTVGTSLLSHMAREKGRKAEQILRDTANLESHQINEDEKEVISQLAKDVSKKLESSSPQETRRMSAELNGIWGYCFDVSQGNQAKDLHCLVSTDTFQGKLTADLLQKYLRSKEFQVLNVFTPQGLNTADNQSFSKGIKQIVKWCHKVIAGYCREGYFIVFNLVGSFKSLQGFMNTLGMFYADEILYIFEAKTADLVRIPRLPIKIESQPILEEKAKVFALMAENHIASREEVRGIPEIYLDIDEEGFATLSEWGLLIWNENEKEILGSLPLDKFNFEGFNYENSFEKDFGKLNKTRRANIVSTLARVAVIYQEKGLAGLRDHTGLRYSDYQGLKERKVGHFRLDQDWRISCSENEGVLYLRHVGSHDYVNNNP
ncbi:MAG: putative CRISPR-associated protein [Firmicutes bacterium]|nr:putative CRISPR-associated protein [Bacillota bacterium]